MAGTQRGKTSNGAATAAQSRACPRACLEQSRAISVTAILFLIQDLLTKCKKEGEIKKNNILYPGVKVLPLSE